MITCKCILKFRDKQGKIYGYRLVDLNRNIQDVEPKNLKNAIKNKQVYVTNLKLTSDNRLVDCEESLLQNKEILGASPKKPKSEYIEEKLIEKAMYISKNCKNSPSIDFDSFDGTMTTSISDDEALTRDITLRFWMWITVNSITFEAAEIDDEDEQHFKHAKEYKLDILNTPNEKLAELENNYKKAIFNLYMK